MGRGRADAGGTHRVRRRRERGSALMLMPAGVLIVIILGAISLDSTVVFVAQRGLIADAEAAANDGAAAAVDQDAFFANGTIRIDQDKLVSVVNASLDARGVHPLADPPVVIRVDPTNPRRLDVRVSIRVDYIFAKGVPGAAHSTVVTATAHAQLVPSG